MRKHSLHMSLRNAQPGIRLISATQPLRWLRSGWNDLKANPMPSLAYSVLLALGGDLIILSALDYPHLLTASISGFFLLAPLLAAGLYELSRARAQGERLSFRESLRAFRRNGQSLAMFGLLLGLSALFWERITAMAFALAAIDTPSSGSVFLNEIIFSGEHLAFTLTWFAVGALLALVVFALSVVSVPYMLDRDADVATAMMISLHAFGANFRPLLGWALLLVTLSLLGFATLIFGQVLSLSILGHASWHAYRELVE